MIKAKIECLKIPSIVNVKRKIINLIIFSIVKLKKDKLSLMKNIVQIKVFSRKLLQSLVIPSKMFKEKKKKTKLKKRKK